MTEPFEVLLFSLGDEVLGATTEDARARHLHYSEGVDHLHIVAWNRVGQATAPVSLSPKLTVYPAGQGGRLAYVRDMLRVGAAIIRNRPIKVLSTQDPFYTAAVGLCLRGLGPRLQIQNHSDFIGNRLWLAERPLWNSALNAFGKWAVRRADRLRVVNTTERQKYIGLGVAAECVDVLPVPVDLTAFKRPVDARRLAELCARWQIAPDAPVLFWVGRPVPFKDLGMLLRAMAIVHRQRPDVRVVFGGDFASAPQWPVLAHDLGLADTVRFVGPVSRDDVPLYFALSSVYLHGSMYEGFGRVMLEAAAAGRAVIATRTAGAIDIIRDGETGLLCPPRDPISFADAALRLLDDPVRAQRMGERARAWAKEQFDPDKLTNGIVAAWRKCAK